MIYVYIDIHSTATWLIGDNLKRTTKSWDLLSFWDMFLNPSFKMTTSFASEARITANIFINLPNQPDRIISVVVFWLHVSYWHVIKLYLKEDCFQYFSVRLFYYLCFVFHCVFRFYHGPPRFHDLLNIAQPNMV